jgi:coenzyme F420-reducing hydrogenase gamma subunit
MEKMKLSKAVELVENSISSIFNKQDVLALLGSIDTEPDMEHINEIFDKVKINFAHGLRCAEEGIVDKDNIELELNGKEISVYNVEVDLEHIESVLEEVLDDLYIEVENN